jgi:hypothetical protein
MPFLGPEHDTRSAKQVSEDALRDLVTKASIELSALRPTPELRWVDRWTDIGGGIMRGGLPVLEQRWACVLTGKSEWRDVPVVRE